MVFNILRPEGVNVLQKYISLNSLNFDDKFVSSKALSSSKILNNLRRLPVLEIELLLSAVLNLSLWYNDSSKETKSVANFPVASSPKFRVSITSFFESVNPLTTVPILIVHFEPYTCSISEVILSLRIIKSFRNCIMPHFFDFVK